MKRSSGASWRSANRHGGRFRNGGVLSTRNVLFHVLAEFAKANSKFKRPNEAPSMAHHFRQEAEARKPSPRRLGL